MSYTVGRLRESLEDYRDDVVLLVRIVVGGDLVTDDVELVDVHYTGGGQAGPYIALEPASDLYRVREHIDNGIAASHAVADAGALGNGYVRWTRDADGEVILDHVDATRVVILDEAP